MNLTRRLLWASALLVSLVAVGTIGYIVIEGWSVLDALYMTIITLSTVGFQEVHALSTAGKFFTIFLIVGGVGGALYTLTTVMQYLVEGQFSTALRRRRMNERISRLQDHFILCGYGRVGQAIGRYLLEEHASFVVVDEDPDAIAMAQSDNCLFLLGDGTNDEVLIEAGIRKARAIIISVDTDADGTFITLSARGLNPRLPIIARANEENSISKIQRAGADHVISPQHMGARRMAMLATRPVTVDLVDTIMDGKEKAMLLEEVRVRRESALPELLVKDGYRLISGVVVLAVQKKGGKLITNPFEEARLEPGDGLIVVGSKEQLKGLEALL